MDENARAEPSAWAQSRPHFVHTAARIGCPACPVLSHADRPQHLCWSGMRPHWPPLSVRGCALRCARRRTLLDRRRGGVLLGANRSRKYAARLAQFSGKAKWTTCGAIPLALRRAHRASRSSGQLSSSRTHVAQRTRHSGESRNCGVRAATRPRLRIEEAGVRGGRRPDSATRETELATKSTPPVPPYGGRSSRRSRRSSENSRSFERHRL